MVPSRQTCFNEVSSVVNQNSVKPWKYTDDIIAIAIVIAWIAGKFLGVDIPDWVVSAAIGYAFGKSMPRGGGRCV